ncbi:MAG: ABC transporter ATP-binding protein [Terrisporobacter othiniensis]|uniref:ABC transporter ATP-binding protein n=1 Tax=Terrisporobacter petrolearius TaxID=1460447 RepID=UPI0022E12026|nr:ABC transporter ATP-binding protein [Terrisporobacter petrolearius]MDU4860226.1 ABC transporter ATP-binding protein [Terrisporobacter othiniensis]MDU6996367.1 ABC transporter ATP-binding protein [Terrisporobacter othiniensis]
MLEVKNLYCGYDGKDIIKNISFNVKNGENLCIVGPNGCGKSTLLKSIVNIIDYKGSIKIDNKESFMLSRVELAKKVGLMSQMSQLYFPYTVYDTVSLGRYAYSKGPFSKLSYEDKQVIVDSMNKVGVYDLKDKMITELSGGQLQRVFLARIFAQDPDIILLDEPTNHLDFKNQIDLLENLNEWVKSNNKIVIGVLHDLNLVQYFADKVLMIKDGEEISYGTPEKVLKDKLLNDIYGIDIKNFMVNILQKWA